MAGELIMARGRRKGEALDTTPTTRWEPPPSMPSPGPPPRAKSPEVAAAEILARPLDRIAAALERIADQLSKEET